jgi:hypothetical protein
VKCTRRIRNVQGKGNYRVERDFRVSKWFYLVEGLLYFTYFRATVPFRLSKKIRMEVVGGRLPKSSTKHHPERGGLQRLDRVVTSVGYHN